MPRVTRALAALPAALFFHAAAFAGIGVSPVMLELAPGQKAVSVTVRNTGDAPVTVQAEVQRWTRAGAGDLYAADPAALVTPPLFKLPPGAEQVVRLGFPAGLPPQALERADRLWFREVTPPTIPAAADAPGQVQWRLNIGVPVFVQPTAVKRDVHFTARAAVAPGMPPAVDVTVRNTGTVRARLSRVSLRGAGGARLGELAGLNYVFPGEARTLRVPVGALPAPGARLVCEAEAEQGVLRSELALGGE